MARITLKTRIDGPLTFGVTSSGGYVRIYGHPTIKDGAQICDGGRTAGSTLLADETSLPAVARRWLRQYRVRYAEFGM